AALSIGLCAGAALDASASDEVESLLQWRALGAHDAVPLPEPEPQPAEVAAPEAPPADPSQPCRIYHGDNIEMIDDAARMLHETLCGASLWFDGLFGERNLDAARSAHGRLELSTTYSEYYGFKERVRLNVRVDLPNLKNRLSAFVGRDDEDEFVRDRSEGFALRSQFPSIDDRDEWLAGLGYSLPGNDRLKSDFRVGVRDLRETRAFVQYRVRYNAYSDQRNLLHFRLTPFYNTRDGFGITPGFDYSYVITNTRLLRWSNIGTLSDNTEGLDWRSALILYQSVGEGRGAAVEGFIRGATTDDVSVREYGGRLIYRHPLAQQRLFLELVSGYSWPREEIFEEREGSFLVAAGLELPFGHRR
ncbi:MAG: hypothetical protein ACT4PG_02975, partial [Panacagrimonas sp.]